MPNEDYAAHFPTMSTAALTLKKPVRPRTRTAIFQQPAKPSKRAIAEAWARSSGIVSTKPATPSKRVIAETWAKLTGIVNTGETDLSTREGFGY